MDAKLKYIVWIFNIIGHYLCCIPTTFPRLVSVPSYLNNLSTPSCKSLLCFVVTLIN